LGFELTKDNGLMSWWYLLPLPYFCDHTLLDPMLRIMDKSEDTYICHTPLLTLSPLSLSLSLSNSVTDDDESEMCQFVMHAWVQSCPFIMIITLLEKSVCDDQPWPCLIYKFHTPFFHFSISSCPDNTSLGPRPHETQILSSILTSSILFQAAQITVLLSVSYSQNQFLSDSNSYYYFWEWL
jgi:hypothetical protein